MLAFTILAFTLGAGYAAYDSTKTCKFCGHHGGSSLVYPLCQACKRDRG